ncbi:hypothetical protein UFOVP235_33 [uncultured Caudovirales phage]|uniref:Uncharacterized protein n=1 Tax=uncultured Caudovirales phage TaxID=2100421 RepID=A0A6J7WU07_9CAUD|nr:hypothetical protein UFOVP235_33 [uncultured Caudovirales phage]
MSSEIGNFEVVKIGKAKADEAVIEHAEMVLQCAKSGQLRSLLWIGENIDGSHTHGITCREDDYKTLAYLERLKHRIQLLMDIDSYEPEEPEEDEGD